MAKARRKHPRRTAKQKRKGEFHHAIARSCPFCKEHFLYEARDTDGHFKVQHGIGLSKDETVAILGPLKDVRELVKYKLQSRLLQRARSILHEKQNLGLHSTPEDELGASGLRFVDALAGIDRQAWRSVEASINANASILRRLIENKWRQLRGARKFGLDPERSYPLDATGRWMSALGIARLIYSARDGAECLAVDLVFHDERCAPMQLRVGHLIASRVGGAPLPASLALFLTLICVFHYFCLVTQASGGPTKSPVARGRARADGAGDGNAAGALGEGEVRLRVVPRRVESLGRRSRGDMAGSHAPSAVDAFRRRLPEGQTPSLEKILDADAFGIELAGPGYPDVRYTWVRPHSRGSEGRVPVYDYRSYDALRALDTIFDAITTGGTAGHTAS